MAIVFFFSSACVFSEIMYAYENGNLSFFIEEKVCYSGQMIFWPNEKILKEVSFKYKKI